MLTLGQVKQQFFKQLIFTTMSIYPVLGSNHYELLGMFNIDSLKYQPISVNSIPQFHVEYVRTLIF